MTAPATLRGTTLLRIARAWFEAETVATVFEPFIADWQRDCLDNPNARRVICQLRAYAAFARMFLVALPVQVRRSVPLRVAVTGWIAAEVFVVLGIVAQMLAFFGTVQWNLTPAAAATALPLALVPTAILLATIGRARPTELRSMMLRLALVTVVVLLPVILWLLPLGNQSYRESRRPIPMQYADRGTREMFVTELVAEAPPADAINMIQSREQWQDARVSALAERVALVVLPFTMATLGTAAAALSTAALAPAFFWWLTGGWILLTTFDHDGVISHPILLALAAGLTFGRSRRHRTIRTPQG
jgi:hypothetical protein